MFAKVKTLLSALLLTAAVASAPLARAADPQTLNFGLISTESSAALRTNWDPIAADLSKAIGMPVKLFLASDYAGVIEGMRFNKVQLAWYGNQAAVEAVDRANGEVFAHMLYQNGDPGYWSVLVTAKDSPLKTLDDVLKNIHNLSYGAGDPNSASGYSVPNYYLWLAHKVDPKKDFKNVRVADHEVNLLSAINNQVDVAITNTETLTSYNRNSGKKWEDGARILWKSPIIPTDPLVWRTDLSPDLKKKILAFFVNYGHTPEESAKLARLNYKGFEASSNGQLTAIRLINLASDRAKVEADASLSAADKQKRIAEIDAKRAALDQQSPAH